MHALFNGPAELIEPAIHGLGSLASPGRLRQQPIQASGLASTRQNQERGDGRDEGHRGERERCR